MSEHQLCPSKETLVAALYEEATADERRLVRAHAAMCAACRDELEALRGIRDSLRGWDAPSLPSHFRVVADPVPPSEETVKGGHVVAGPPRWFSHRGVAAAALAAAATLVLGVSAGLANLDVTMGGGQGLRVRTGWNHGQAPATPAGSPVASPRLAEAPATAATDAGGVADVRAELVALEQRLRTAIASNVTRPSVVAPVPSASRADDEALLRRVQALIDASEIRQQQNLALRMTELARDFDVQRKADFVRIQQGLGKLEGRADAEAVRNQQLMNYIVRVSSPQR